MRRNNRFAKPHGFHDTKPKRLTHLATVKKHIARSVETPNLLPRDAVEVANSRMIYEGISVYEDEVNGRKALKHKTNSGTSSRVAELAPPTNSPDYPCVGRNF
jgi:hypothetical protein